MTAINYKELAILKKRYADCGLKIIAFPSNTFFQEPLDNKAIKEWNSKNEGVNFDVYSKILVNGGCEHPFYTYLKYMKGGWFISAIKWNYTKFLVNKKGIPVKRYGPKDNPLGFENDVKAECGK